MNVCVCPLPRKLENDYITGRWRIRTSGGTGQLAGIWTMLSSWKQKEEKMKTASLCSIDWSIIHTENDGDWEDWEGTKWPDRGRVCISVQFQDWRYTWFIIFLEMLKTFSCHSLGFHGFCLNFGYSACCSRGWKARKYRNRPNWSCHRFVYAPDSMRMLLPPVPTNRHQRGD